MVAATIGQFTKIFFFFLMTAAQELRSHMKGFSRSRRNVKKLIIKLNTSVQKDLIKYMNQVEGACLVFSNAK